VERLLTSTDTVRGSDDDPARSMIYIHSCAGSTRETRSGSRAADGRAADRHRKNRGGQVCIPMPIDWEGRIAAEHAFMIETVGQALGEYGDMIIESRRRSRRRSGSFAPK
jgi:hypothetical protein